MGMERARGERLPYGEGKIGYQLNLQSGLEPKEALRRVAKLELEDGPQWLRARKDWLASRSVIVEYALVVKHHDRQHPLVYEHNSHPAATCSAYEYSRDSFVIVSIFHRRSILICRLRT